MIKSMTGFGRSECTQGQQKISVEIKSVNHRFLEAGIKMPKKLNVFESRIRDLLKKYASRGKIDIFINYEDLSENKVNLKYNSDIAAEYMDILRQMAGQFSMNNDVSIGALSKYPEVITMEESQPDEEEVWNFIEKAILEACESFVRTRIAEGENLKNDLLKKLSYMEELVAFIETRSPEIMKEYRAKLENK
ncbi:MAG: YicC/YloC family endoribonuclease, partial [Eubacteriales bacterium]|nr:YicC/YloC family endoribonuclease [Eubacteriales bacterium]